MSTTKYTQDHEWLRIEEDGLVTIGITDFAQDQLGDLVYLQLPESGKEFTKGEEAAVIESVKTAGEILAPCDGTVVEANARLNDEPGTVNADPMGAGWFFRMKVASLADLGGFMDEAGYKDYVASLG